MHGATGIDCKMCPIPPECTRAPKRTLSVPFDEAVRQAVIVSQKTEASQSSRRFRKKVEMLFAHMKQHFRFTRLKLRGLAGVGGRVLRWWRPSRTCAALSDFSHHCFRVHQEFALPSLSPKSF
jgi:hypothetical protein